MVVFIDAVEARYVAELLIPLNIVVLSCKLGEILAEDAGNISNSTYRACGQVALVWDGVKLKTEVGVRRYTTELSSVAKKLRAQT